MKNSGKDSGGFYRELASLVLPITVQNLMTALVSAADVVMAGAVSQTALSAVSLASQVQFVLSLFYAGLTIGTTVLASQYWGKGDQRAVEQVLGIALKFSGLISAVFFIGAAFFPRWLMMIFTSDGQLIRAGIPYLRIVSVSYLFMGVSQIYLCIMKNAGKAVLSTVISSSAMILNIILNAVLIFGLLGFPKLGIAGAAAATAVSRFLELIWCMAIARTPGAVKIHLRDIVHCQKVLFKDFIRYTGPVLANEMAWGLGFTMYSVIMGHLGSDAVAANSVANVVKNLVTSLCLGVGSGGGILLGTVLGRGEVRRAKEYAGRLLRTAVLSGVLGGGIILLARPLILSLSGLTDTAEGYLSAMLLICSYYVIGKALNATLVAGIFCAGGDTRFGLVCDTINMWLFVVPLGLLCAFVFKMPVLVVYFVISLDEIVKIPFEVGHYKKYQWLNILTRDLENPDQDAAVSTS